MYIYLITMIGDKLGSMSNKSLNGSVESINIPADYSTIQGGIDASTNGDTVLVHLIVRQTSLFDETRRMY